MSLNKHYDHQQHESDIYQLWEKHDAFNPDTYLDKSPDIDEKKEPYTIIMPPPNANDPLHVGHAMFVALEDAMVRYHRMLGDDTLWLPGTDHAGIETQYVFEKKLKKKGRSRFNFDRETLYQKIWEYVQENSDVAVNQIKKLGASADWSRYKFTLDEDVVDSVLETFKKLDKEKLIYRANRLVNYCTKCGTSFSELEIEHTDQTSPLFYIKYGPLTVATTRPETKFADVALAVHPEDKRYQKHIGQTIEVKGLFKTYQLPVIADEFVDPEFGTGVVKITPFHDKNDFEFYQRHENEIAVKPKKAVNYEGRMTSIAGKYKRLKAHIARAKVANDLKEAGLLVKTNQNYKNKVSTCYRCHRPIEPLPSTQFYVRVKPLIEPVSRALEKDELKVHGAGHQKILKHWLNILEDWNISRQIVWGIRMPVWYNSKDNPDLRITYVNSQGENLSGKLGTLLKTDSLKNIKQGLQSLSAPLSADYIISKDSPGENYIQETDTFDTWFSSSQWPVVTLKNNKPGDFDRFYPTQLMETGYDILMFWVMRMLMMGKFITGKLPFKNIYLHGLIRDEKGIKMSKSKGNVINPLETAQKYGTDALRMALVIRSSAGLDKSVGHPEFKAARNLTNKMWNATRFILMNLNSDEISLSKPLVDQLEDLKLDQSFSKKLAKVTQGVSRQLDEYKMGLAAETLYNEFWHWFCDQGIEQTKKGQVSQANLLRGLKIFLKLFHPFMPFITETLWQELKERNLVSQPMLISAAWPATNLVDAHY